MKMPSLSEMTQRQRILVFIGFIIVAVGVMVGAIILSGDGSTKTTQATPDNDGTSEIVVPSDTASPTPVKSVDPSSIPTSAADAVKQNEEKTPIATPDPSTYKYSEPSDKDTSKIADIAGKGVTAWCVIGPGETYDSRVAKMKQYFTPDSTIINSDADLDGLIYQRKCTLMNVSEPQESGTNGYTVFVTMNTAYVYDKKDTTGTQKMVQYTVTMTGDAIVDIK